jgi:hypothetical protein
VLFRKSSFFLLFFFASTAQAYFYPIIKLHNRTQVIAEIPDGRGLAKKSMVVITDESDKVISTLIQKPEQSKSSFSRSLIIM